MLFQKTALQDFLTVRQSLELFRSFYDRGLEVDEVIRRCALQDLVNRDTRKLSGGQLQRVLLGIALVNDPAVHQRIDLPGSYGIPVRSRWRAHSLSLGG